MSNYINGEELALQFEEMAQAAMQDGERERATLWRSAASQTRVRVKDAAPPAPAVPADDFERWVLNVMREMRATHPQPAATKETT